MENKIFITLIIASALILSACGSNGAETTSDSNTQSNNGTDSQTSPSQPDTGTTLEMPLSTKLAIGTLKLEETEFAIASDQASNLLPLWQVLRSLTSSDTAVQEEVDAVIDQIEETMTPEQLTAIDGMGLTNENVFAAMQELGLVLQQVDANGTPQPRGNFQGGGGQGIPGGGPGGGGGPCGFGGESGQLSPEQIATAQARRAENGGNAAIRNRMLAPLINAVVELLESKQ